MRASSPRAVGGEGIIAAAVGALAGGGGLAGFRRLVGPDRDAAIAAYYREVIEDLQKENTQLRGELSGLRARVLALELAQDHPPPHLG